MTEVVLDTIVGETDAQRVVRTNAPAFQVVRSSLTYHPFSGFMYRMDTPWGRSKRVYTLVDRCNGKTFITEPWQTAAGRDPRAATVEDPGWSSVTFAEARRRSRQTAASAAPGARPSGRPGGLDERLRHPTVWKPNWVLDGVVGGRTVRVQVDGVDGSYAVVGS